MNMNTNRILQSMAGAAMAVAMMAGAQSPAPPAPEAAASAAPAADNSAILKDIEDMKARIAQLEAQLKAQAAAAAAPAPAVAAAPAAPAAPTWSVGPMDVSGYVDAYYSFNANRPNNDSDAGQYNQLYNFNDVTNQFALSAAKLTLNHDPDPVGAHIDFLYGRTDTQVNGSSDSYTNSGAGKYIEQAFLSFKPVKAKGFEADFGKFATSAGAEVIESKDNWNYSRSLLFAHAIPYTHIGLRTSYPLTKAWTVGVQVVNGVYGNFKSNSGVSWGFTSAYVKPKYTWSANYYTGPQNYDTQKGYLNLFDTTLLLTPTAKFSAYLNYDYGQNRVTDSNPPYHSEGLAHWQGVAIAAREQFAPKDAVAARYEFYFDPNGYTIGNGDAANCDFNDNSCRTQMQELTLTYEHKWIEGLLARVEYRHDWTNANYFTKGNYDGKVKAQSTLTAGFVAFFGPKR
jgi:hypothetical protein